MMARPRPSLADFGVLLVDKPAGPTSHDVVDWVRWCTRIRSVGHCGTLDPAATGLLVLCLGSATRLAVDLTGVDKTYRARFRVGVATDTADGAGSVTRTARVPSSASPAVMTATTGLRGALSLPPPAYSALRVQGVRSHTLARRGEGPRLDPRPMAVRAMSNPRVCEGEGWLDVEVELTVSKGTYIRSLAEELGRRTGFPCHLRALRRTRCGPTAVDDALAGLLASPLPPRANGAPRWRIRAESSPDRETCAQLVFSHLRAPDECLPYPVFVAEQRLRGDALERLSQGQRIPIACDLAAGPSPSKTDSDAAAHPGARVGFRGIVGDQSVFVVAERVEEPSPAWAPTRVLRPRSRLDSEAQAPDAPPPR
ncbi:MAG: tRNA pseudouridine(55) synthase TruB [Myxococcales bacterium FL481]|nr:MAG: tRNA pseudouridine(55) synthase TruB [Myxococcales bacterium FL481]